MILGSEALDQLLKLSGWSLDDLNLASDSNSWIAIPVIRNSRTSQDITILGTGLYSILLGDPNTEEIFEIRSKAVITRTGQPCSLLMEEYEHGLFRSSLTDLLTVQSVDDGAWALDTLIGADLRDSFYASIRFHDDPDWVHWNWDVLQGKMRIDGVLSVDRQLKQILFVDQY